LPKTPPSKNSRKKLMMKRPVPQKGQRPFGEGRLAREGGRYNRRGRCRQKQPETAKGEKEEQAERYSTV
jgi:hypothetical protein